MEHQRNVTESVFFFWFFDVPCSKRSWINLYRKETQNPFSDLTIHSWILWFIAAIQTTKEWFFFHHFFQHHCRICGRIFCNNCSNNWLQTPHSRYWSCHLILAVHRDQVIVVRLLQTRPFDKNLCELTQKTPIKQTNSDKLSLSACYRLQTLLIVQTRKNPWSICKEFACVSLFGVVPVSSFCRSVVVNWREF